jgi:hypothetical protein
LQFFIPNKIQRNCIFNFNLQNISIAFIEPAIVLSMFLLSSIFVMVCGLFEWKRICVFFFYIVCVFPLEMQLSKVGFGIPLTSSTPSHFCACSKSGPGFPTSDVVFFLCSVKMRGYCSLWWIDDHYWLNILFMIIWYFLENLIKDILNAKILPVFKTQSKLLYVHGWECLRT